MASRFTKDDAEMAKRHAEEYYQLPGNLIFVRNLDDVLKPARNKFGAKAVWYDNLTGLIHDAEVPGDVIRFDSTIEAKVYQFLRTQYPRTAIARQYHLMIKPSTKFYDRLDWRVDFRVALEGKYLNIEVKGLALPDFKRNLQFLQCFNHYEWERTIIVSSEAQKIDAHKTAYSFNQFCLLFSKQEIRPF